METQFSGGIPTPAPMWSSPLKTGASQNFLRYCTPEFDKPVEQINAGADEAKPRQLFRWAMDLPDQDALFIVAEFTEHSALWRNYLKWLVIEKWIHSGRG